MGRFLALAACLVTAGCSAPAGSEPATPTGPPPVAGPPAAPREDSLGVYECVLRYRLQKYPSGVRAFVSVAGEDAPPELLDRLREDWPNLRPASEDRENKGLSVYAEEVRWEQGRAVVRAGYWFPTKYAGEGYFADHHVVREGGRWVVKELTDETIS